MNRLQNEKSPYLLQHADNPVDWRPWGDDAFKAARREDKPVFLSIGYSTCHWCHVMAHESFESEDVAEAINRDFIAVKVDREERPDVDSVYMSACLAINGSGGWPLTALLTPEQKPFWVGTYLPKQQLLSLLEQAHRLWQADRKSVESSGEMLTEHLRMTDSAQPGTPRREIVHEGVTAFVRMFDPVWGGFGHAPKFPSAHNLLFLLCYSKFTGDARARVMAETTLEHIYRGGIYDHVGGGFSRYSTDERWLVPHFEKMLYDNALLALAYTEAYRMTGRGYCRDAACSTLDYCISELALPQGGFSCGQDADSDGVEGKFYVFTKQELDALLGEDSDRFCRRFGVTCTGDFHRKSVLNLTGTEDWEHEPHDITELKSTVRSYRKSRAPLHRDDKVLTSWNGLIIAALSRTGAGTGERKYLETAADAVRFIEANLRDSGDRLLARWRDGDAAHPGKLEDYSFYVWGLLELYNATFDIDYLEKAFYTAGQMTELFFDAENGGFYPYSSVGEQLITRRKESYDGALPSGNAVAALVLSRLGRLSGDQSFRDAAALQLRWLAGAAEREPSGHAFTLLTFLEELWPAEELLVSTAEMPDDLPHMIWSKQRPNLTVLVKTPANSAQLAAIAPLTAEYPIPEAGAQYYLCRGGSCQAPAESLDELDSDSIAFK